MAQYVFALDKAQKPVMPCSTKRARKLLSTGRAVVHKTYPFTIRIKDISASECTFQDLQLKVDPCSKTTGVAVVLKNTSKYSVRQLFNLAHRGYQISEALSQRRAFRRRRRNQLRYRPARFNNRVNSKKKGWLAPSIRHRVTSTMNFIHLIRKLTPVNELGLERVKFDTQLMDNPDISGVEYQQGTLKGYELREYILLKNNHTCQYCNGVSGDSVLNIEHILPKSRGGSNRLNNLTLACRTCNEHKNNYLLSEWKSILRTSKLDKQRIKNIEKFEKGKRSTLKDASAVNSTRNAIFREFINTGLTVSTGTGGMTKFNRHQYQIPKDHALDAVCVGEINLPIENWQMPISLVKCQSRGSYQRTRLNKYGFPRGYLMRQKSVFGFKTGDMAKATVTSGKKQGVYIGKVSVRKTGSFNITTKNETVQGISHKYCELIQRGQGFLFY